MLWINVLFLQLRTSHHSHWTVLFWLSLFLRQASRHLHKHLAPPPASRAQGTREASAPVDLLMALHLPAAWWHQQLSLAVGCPLWSQPLFHRLVAWALRLREVPPRVDNWDSKLLPRTLAAQGKAPAARPQDPQSLLKGTWQHTKAVSIWSYSLCCVILLPHLFLQSRNIQYWCKMYV